MDQLHGAHDNGRAVKGSGPRPGLRGAPAAQINQLKKKRGRSSIFSGFVRNVKKTSRVLFSLRRVESGQPVTINASYIYDDQGIRVEATVGSTVGQGSPVSTVTQYLIDGSNPTGFSQVLEEHVNGSGVPSVSYVSGMAVLGQLTGAGAQWLLVDGRGSTRLLTDPLANVLARYVYDAYGNVLGQPVGALNVPVTRILFVGQQFDPVLMQYYLRARNYVPSLGRFISADSFSGDMNSPQTLHKYLYSGADPINYFDPSGHCDLALGFGGLLGSLDLLISVASYATYVAWGVLAVGGALLTILGTQWIYVNVRNTIVELLTSGDSAAETEGLVLAANSQAAALAVQSSVNRAVAAGALTTAASAQSFPIFFVVESTGRQIYHFDVAALLAYPQWHVLNYNGRGNPATLKNPLWVWGKYWWLMEGAPVGYQLDEFPYASTVQGGKTPPGAWGAPVPGWENWVQGIQLTLFYAYGVRWVARAPFLVVPVPI